MSVTLDNILSRPVMSGAIVRAGNAGLDNIVSGIGIVDQFDNEFNYDEVFSTSKYLLGEILLSSYFITFPLATKIGCLHFLDRVGASGIIVMNVGFFAEDFEPEVIETAAALNFPLIQLPSNKHVCSELITQIMEIIIEDRKSRDYWTNIILEYIARLPDKERSIDVLTDIISQYTHASIGLYDSKMNLLYGADWARDPFKPLADENYTAALHHKPKTDGGSFISYEGILYHYICEPFLFNYSTIKNLSVISAQGPISRAQFQQVAEAVKLYLSIWEKGDTNHGALCRALRKNEPIKAQRLAQLLGISLCDITAMLIFSISDAARNDITAMKTKIEEYCSKRNYIAIAEATENMMTAFVSFPNCTANCSDFCREAEKEFSSCEDVDMLFFHFSPYSAGAYKDVFDSYMTYHEYMREIFPQRKTFHSGDLPFVSECAVIAADKNTSDKLLSVLTPITGVLSTMPDLLKTLAVFFIDADSSVDKAAELLYVHKGTIKYRIKRANEIFGFDIRKNPEFLTIYKALAVYRILKQ